MEKKVWLCAFCPSGTTNNLTVVSETPVEAGDVVSVEIGRDQMLGRVICVIETREGSELQQWLQAFTKVAERKVLEVYKAAP